MFEAQKDNEKKGFPTAVALIVGLAAVVGGTAFWLLSQAEPEVAPEKPLTEEARSYLPQLQLSPDTGMEAKEDALGQTLLEITGDITNNGDRVCERIEVNVVFRDVTGIEIHRQRAAIVDRRTGALEPGDRQVFRMAFDNVPPTWNQAFPSLYIASIDFAASGE